MYRSNRSNLATLDNLLHTSVLRVIPIHDRLGKQHTMTFTCLDHLGRLLRIQRCGLFTQDMFSRLGSFDCPFPVQMIRQRNIDSLDIRISQKLLVTAIGSDNVHLFSYSFRFFLRAAGNRQHFTTFGLLNRRNNCFLAIVEVPSTPHCRGLFMLIVLSYRSYPLPPCVKCQDNDPDRL